MAARGRPANVLVGTSRLIISYYNMHAHAHADRVAGLEIDRIRALHDVVVVGPRRALPETYAYVRRVASHS